MILPGKVIISLPFFQPPRCGHVPPDGREQFIGAWTGHQIPAPTWFALTAVIPAHEVPQVGGAFEGHAWGSGGSGLPISSLAIPVEECRLLATNAQIKRTGTSCAISEPRPRRPVAINAERNIRTGDLQNLFAIRWWCVGARVRFVSAFRLTCGCGPSAA